MPKKKFRLAPKEIAAAVGAQVEDVQANWPLVEEALERQGLTGAATKIAAIATIRVEVGNGFEPIDEYGDAAYFTRMYERRVDLGNTRKGDGARFHGRGYIQLTGRANYRSYGEKLGVRLEQNPKMALRPRIAAGVLAAYFEERAVGASAEKGEWEAVRKKVNGGLNGWPVFRAAVRSLELANEGGRPPRPPKRRRTLALTSPHTEGRDVAVMQRALGVHVDREYGPVTAGAVSDWKRRSGYKAVDGELTVEDQAYLVGEKKLPAAYVRRAKQREADGTGATVPEQAVAVMERWAKAHYAERPAGTNRVPQLVRLAGKLGVARAYRPMGFAWCAFSALLAALDAGGTSADCGLRQRKFNALYVPDVLTAAQDGRFGLRVVSQTQAKRGDLVVFDWHDGGDIADHVGRLQRPPANGVVHSVDGNTGAPNMYVLERSRPQTLVRAYVRDS
jgi:hypothetical protein